ncbi:MAG TPA: glutamine amidotransferase [Gemmatimonadaceae bacterium]|nr:glutamine amidotransferase [Gemmatimonadaceae bacterium]
MEAALDALFEFLFKYRPVVFEHGTFSLEAPVPVALLVLVAAAVIAAALFTYRRVRGRATRRDRIVLGTLRAMALALVAFALLRPTLAVSEAVPQRNVLGILIDDSRSMRIADDQGVARSAIVRQLFARDSALSRELSERFVLRYFRAARTAGRITGVEELAFDGGRTHLAASLDGARQELGAVPLAGLVLVSDGADNAQVSSGGTDLEETLLGLEARGVPVYTVGLGRESWNRDIQVSRVEAPRLALEGATLVVTALVSQRGYAGQRVPLIVEDGGRIVSRQEIVLPPDGEPTPVRIRVPAAEAGARALRFYIPPQTGEMVAENNSQGTLVIVRDAREKILYVEGEPRFEPKFLRRAVEGDEQLQVVLLQRTAENKYLRLDVDDSLELAGGFPRTREELFAYRGLVLGSIEASAFTLDQLRMIADFVAERGGGLMMLGGRRAFAEGGYGGTSLGEVLPVELDAGRSGIDDEYFVPLRVNPTPAGLGHAVTQLAPDAEASAARWRTLPVLSSVNAVRRIKPGATLLLTGEDTSSSTRHVVLAAQRYGRGLSVALPVQDAWLWRMHAEMPVEDLTHETFWRQMLRWLVSDVPGHVVANAGTDLAEPGDPIALRADVRGSTYLEVNDARVEARITAPNGDTSVVPLEWIVERDGEYEGSFTPPDSGIYEIAVRADTAGGELESATTFVRVGELPTEYYDAELRTPLLRRVAERTGGRFYTRETVSALPRDVVYTSSGTVVTREKELWDMPVLFFLLAALLAGEWTYRRARGLA